MPAPAPRAESRRAVWRALAWLALLLAAALCGPPRDARAQGVELASLAVSRTDEGVLLSYHATFELPRSVEDALQRGVPLYFEAQANLMQSRWYWRDRRVASATRTWRITYQPLTRAYRVGSGGLNQSFETLAEALDLVRSASRWKIADAALLDDEEARHYVDFSFRLDTSQLPRPMQLGIGGEASWALSAERSVRLN